MYVIEFGTINGTSATGIVLAVVAAVVVGGVNIFGGSGTLAGAALGALFLGFIANALILVGLSQFWLQAIYGAVISARRQRRRGHPATDPASDHVGSHAMSSGVPPADGQRRWVPLLARWETLLVIALIGLIVLGATLSPFFLTPGNFSNLITALMEVAIMALPMTLIIVAGEIDLSVESMVGPHQRRPWIPVGGRRAAMDRDPVRPRRGRPRRTHERPAHRARRSAVAGRDPRNPGPLSRTGPDRARTARRQR